MEEDVALSEVAQLQELGAMVGLQEMCRALGLAGRVALHFRAADRRSQQEALVNVGET